MSKSDDGARDGNHDVIWDVAQLSIHELMVASAIVGAMAAVEVEDRERAILLAASVALREIVQRSVSGRSATMSWMVERAEEATSDIGDRLQRAMRVRAGVELPAGDVEFDEAVWRQRLGWT